MNELVQALLAGFANNFTFYLKSHNYHWTVMGPNFPQYHELLEEIYSDAQENIDNYAEQIRRLGYFPQGDYRDIVNYSQLSDPPETITDPQVMWDNLLVDLGIIILHLQNIYDLANEGREYGLQNFLAERIDQHRKTQWKLNAILAQQTITSIEVAEPTEDSLPRVYEDGTEFDANLPALYQDAENESVPDGQACENCQYYDSSKDYCSLFDAEVRPLYWCAKWAPELAE